ncbi:aldo/keto reductase [Corynebacterium halotolerans YIM 70093 = DSM 44683]|uniref:Aldo/keto reductase n=1 Tax=Corynebacterium halotolerans YIM 70093 = DSM 44683 TaxID=1121362 RepID=M1P0M6_9CORY|nr:aldo/keto reductase [Corynebacterium halotolerans YIM 70093 = DSM 44683]
MSRSRKWSGDGEFATAKVEYLGLSHADADTVWRAHAVHPVSVLQSGYSIPTGVSEELLGALQELGSASSPTRPWRAASSAERSGRATPTGRMTSAEHPVVGTGELRGEPGDHGPAHQPRGEWGSASRSSRWRGCWPAATTSSQVPATENVSHRTSPPPSSRCLTPTWHSSTTSPPKVAWRTGPGFPRPRSAADGTPGANGGNVPHGGDSARMMEAWPTTAMSTASSPSTSPSPVWPGPSRAGWSSTARAKSTSSRSTSSSTPGTSTSARPRGPSCSPSTSTTMCSSRPTAATGTPSGPSSCAAPRLSSTTPTRSPTPRPWA